MNETKYLYCVNENGNEDFITISYTLKDDVIFIYNFYSDFLEVFDPKLVKFVAIDYSYDPFSSFNFKYTNSNALKTYSVEFIEEDLDRMTVTLKIKDKVENFDLQSYKRDSKISNILS
jgi:hypothetical protein